jgi:hypothetical protein
MFCGKSGMATGGSDTSEEGTHNTREKRSWYTAIIPFRNIYNTPHIHQSGNGY